MASDSEQSEAVHEIIGVQVRQLQSSLRETTTLAANHGHGVLVVWSGAPDVAGQMKVEMFVDPDVPLGEVKFIEQ